MNRDVRRRIFGQRRLTIKEAGKFRFVEVGYVSAKANKGVVEIKGTFWGAMLRAVISIVFGIVLIAWPSATLKVFLTVFGIFALCFGAFVLIANLAAGEEKENRTAMVVFAVISVVAGIFALAWPSASTRVILAIVGIWAIGIGFMEMVVGMGLPKGFSGKFLLILFSLISIGVGVWLLARPVATGTTEVASVVITVIGIFAIVEGVILFAYAFLLRNYVKELRRVTA